MSNQKAAGNW